MKNGIYQYQLAFVGCLVNLLDGSFFTLSSYVAKFMQLDYFLTDYETGLLSTIILFACLITGPLTAFSLNKIGRKFTICIGALIGTMTAISFSLSETFPMLVVSNIVLSLYMLSVLSTLMIYLVETIAGKNRGRLIVFVYSFFSVGRVYGTILIRLTLSPYRFQSWRLPFMVNSVIIAVLFGVVLLGLNESVKYLFHKKNYSEAREVFNKIQTLNHSKQALIDNSLLLSINEMKKITALDEAAALKTKEDKLNGKVTKNYFILAVLFVVAITSSLYINILQMMIVPFIMGVDTSTLNMNIIITSGEFIGATIMFTLIQNKYFGRRRIIILGNMMLILVFGTLYFFPNDQTILFYLMFTSKIFIKASLSTIFIHLNESLPIQVRDRYVIFVTTLVNLSTFFSGTIFMKLLRMGNEFVYLSGVVYAFISFCTDFFLPNDLEKSSFEQEKEKSMEEKSVSSENKTIEGN